MFENTRVYNPEYEVRIHTRRDGMKTVFATDILRIDVNTTKNGFNSTWRVILAPRDYYNGVTAYDMVEAMDYCEIAVKRFEQKPKVIIRGFVTTVFKSFKINDGKPERYIAISGEDYGKAIRMSYIHYAVGLDPIQLIGDQSTEAPFLAGFGIDMATKPSPASDVIGQIFDKLVLPNFNNIVKLIDARDLKFPNSLNGVKPHEGDKFGKFLTDIDTDGVNGVRGLNLRLKIFDRLAGAKETPVENFLMEMAGMPWNEIFIDNAPNSTFLVYRPSPFRDRDGNFIGATHFAGADGGVTAFDRNDTNNINDILQEDILSYQMERNDREVYNYFFTDSNYTLIAESFEQYMKSASLLNALNNKAPFINPHYTIGEVDIDANNNQIPIEQHRKMPPSDKLEFSRMELFGFKKYAQVSKYISVRYDDEDIEKTYELFGTTDEPPLILTGQKLNDLLFNAFEHISVLETGVLVIKGNENIRPGMFIRFSDDRLNSAPSIYYVTDVNHSIVPFETFTTTVVVTRGEGHLDKRRKAGGVL